MKIVAVFQWGWLSGLVGIAKTGPINTTLPAVTGTAQDGKQLTATTGAWTTDMFIEAAYHDLKK